MSKLGLEKKKKRGTRDQIANICWITDKARKFQKSFCLCFIDYPKAFDCVDHNKLWKALEEIRIPGHLICLLRNIYAIQEATVRTLYGTTDWFKIEKRMLQSCLLSPCLFNLYTECILRNTELDVLQAGIKKKKKTGETSATSDMPLDEGEGRRKVKKSA